MAYSTVIIIRNPSSTGHERAEKFIQIIRSAYPAATWRAIDTAPGDVQANRNLFAKYASSLGKHTLICIAGGDGTCRIVIEALLRNETLSDAARHTPLLPLWCGNANDLARMLNGRPDARKLRRILTDGRVVTIKPLICTLTTSQATSRYTAACYSSFGAIANAAVALNDKTYRESLKRTVMPRQLVEFAIVAMALLRSNRFSIEEDGTKKVIYERLILNGSRLAKAPRALFSITDDEFIRTTVDYKRLSSAFYRSLELLERRRVAQKTAKEMTFTICSDTWAQFDGEPLFVVAGTRVHIAVASEYFCALSLRSD